MRLVIADIPDGGLRIAHDLVLHGEPHGIEAKARLDLDVNMRGADVFVSGTVSAHVEQECARCLKAYGFRLDVPVELVFGPEGEASQDQMHELHSEDMDKGYYSEGELDLAQVGAEQLILQLPIKPLCSTECKGICPKCGADLNESPCGCSTKEIDPRLQALQGFFKNRKE